jgi:hypothetical protein
LPRSSSGGISETAEVRKRRTDRRQDMQNGNNNGKWDRYSGGAWSRLQETTRTIQAEYDRGGNSETALHRLADQLREVFGGVKVAKELIPQIMAEHKKAVEWGLERLLVSVRRLEALPYVEISERRSIEQRIHHIIGLVDGGELDAAEAEVRAVESRVEQLQRASAETEFAALMSGIGEMYQPTVH